MIDKFIQAANYTPASSPRNVKYIVIHTAETPEDENRAEGIAKWVFSGPNAVKASAHYIVDNKHIVQCVRDIDIAWGAKGANAEGIHIEHAGYAKQSETDWEDDYSQMMLERSARLVASLCDKYGVPSERLNWETFAEGKSGIVGHVDVNRAAKGGSLGPSDHWDPGPNFPWDQFIKLVKGFQTNV